MRQIVCKAPQLGQPFPVQPARTIIITDESIAMLEDIINNDSDSPLVRCRLDGDRNVDFNLLFGMDALADMCKLYVESGALNNDFSAIKAAYPCTIK